MVNINLYFQTRSSSSLFVFVNACVRRRTIREVSKLRGHTIVVCQVRILLPKLMKALYQPECTAFDLIMID